MEGLEAFGADALRCISSFVQGLSSCYAVSRERCRACLHGELALPSLPGFDDQEGFRRALTAFTLSPLLVSPVQTLFTGGSEPPLRLASVMPVLSLDLLDERIRRHVDALGAWYRNLDVPTFADQCTSVYNRMSTAVTLSAVVGRGIGAALYKPGALFVMKVASVVSTSGHFVWHGFVIVTKGVLLVSGSLLLVGAVGLFAVHCITEYRSEIVMAMHDQRAERAIRVSGTSLGILADVTPGGVCLYCRRADFLVRCAGSTMFQCPAMRCYDHRWKPRRVNIWANAEGVDRGTRLAMRHADRSEHTMVVELLATHGAAISDFGENDRILGNNHILVCLFIGAMIAHCPSVVDEYRCAGKLAEGAVWGFDVPHQIDLGARKYHLERAGTTKSFFERRVRAPIEAFASRQWDSVFGEEGDKNGGADKVVAATTATPPAVNVVNSVDASTTTAGPAGSPAGAGVVVSPTSASVAVAVAVPPVASGSSGASAPAVADVPVPSLRVLGAALHAALPPSTAQPAESLNTLAALPAPDPLTGVGSSMPPIFDDTASVSAMSVELSSVAPLDVGDAACAAEVVPATLNLMPASVSVPDPPAAPASFGLPPGLPLLGYSTVPLMLPAPPGVELVPRGDTHNTPALLRRAEGHEVYDACVAEGGRIAGAEYLHGEGIRAQAIVSGLGMTDSDIPHIAGKTAAVEKAAVHNRHFAEKPTVGGGQIGIVQQCVRGPIDDVVTEVIKLLKAAGRVGKEFEPLAKGHEPTPAEAEAREHKRSTLLRDFEYMAWLPKSWNSEAGTGCFSKLACDERMKQIKSFFIKLNETLQKIKPRLIQSRQMEGTLVNTFDAGFLENIMFGIPLLLERSVKHATPVHLRARMARLLSPYYAGKCVSYDYASFDSSNVSHHNDPLHSLMVLVENRILAELFSEDELKSDLSKVAREDRARDFLRSTGVFHTMFADRKCRESGDRGTSCLNFLTTLVLFLVILGLESGYRALCKRHPCAATPRWAKGVPMPEAAGSRWINLFVASCEFDIEIVRRWLKGEHVGADFFGEGDDNLWLFLERYLSGAPGRARDEKEEAMLDRFEYWAGCCGTMLEPQDENGKASGANRLQPVSRRMEHCSRIIRLYQTTVMRALIPFTKEKGQHDPKRPLWHSHFCSLCKFITWEIHGEATAHHTMRSFACANPACKHHFSKGDDEQRANTARCQLAIPSAEEFDATHQKAVDESTFTMWRTCVVPKLRKTLTAADISFNVGPRQTIEPPELSAILFTKMISAAFNCADEPMMFQYYMMRARCVWQEDRTVQFVFDAKNYVHRDLALTVCDNRRQMHLFSDMDNVLIPYAPALMARLDADHTTRIAVEGHFEAARTAVLIECPKMDAAFYESFPAVCRGIMSDASGAATAASCTLRSLLGAV